MNTMERMPIPSGTADAVLDALPHPVIMINADDRIANANAAAESFFEASLPLLRRTILARPGLPTPPVTGGGTCGFLARQRCSAGR